MNGIDAGALAVGFEAWGPEGAPPVLLLHGWPDDPSTWHAVGPALAAANRRVLAPAWRGVAPTRFRDPATPRTGDSARLALDTIAFADALGLRRFAVVGHDWGSNVAEALAVGWPERVERLALLSSPPRLGGLPTPPFEQARRQWYHWFQATGRGADAVRADPRGFARIMWETWSPAGWFDEPTFEAVARSFGPDWVDVTLHSYRARWGEAEPDPAGAALTAQVAATKTLSLPAIYLAGDADGVNPPSTAATVPAKFTGPFALTRIPGVGHFPQREAPDAVAAILRAFLADPPQGAA